MRLGQRYTPFEHLLRLVTQVRPGEGRCVALFLAHVFLILFAYYVLRSLREALVLTHGGAEQRTYAQATVALLLVFIIPAYSLVRRRLDGHQLVNAVILAFVVALGLFWIAARSGADVGFAFFVLVGLLSVLVVSQFWALAADSFNVKSGQRLFPVVAVGAALGAVLGARFEAEMVVWIGPHALILIAAAVLALTTLFTAPMREAVPRGSAAVPHGPDRSPRWLGGFAVVRDSRFLLLIALMVVLANIASTLGDYLHSRLVKDHFAGLPPGTAEVERAVYFGEFYSWMTVIQFAIQILLVARIIRAVGVAGAALVLPAIMLVGYGLLSMFPVLTVVRTLRFVEQATEYSLNNTMRNALFLPVGRTETYEGKTAIETFFWRFGDLLAAGLVFLGSSVLDAGVSGFALGNMLIVGAWLGVAVLIGREYRRLARQNLVNAAPQMTGELPVAELRAGEAFEYQLPHDLFDDADPGDVLTLSARCQDGSPLPAWLRFDAERARFHGEPADLTGQDLLIEVRATDTEGVSVTGILRLRQRSD